MVDGGIQVLVPGRGQSEGHPDGLPVRRLKLCSCRRVNDFNIKGVAGGHINVRATHVLNGSICPVFFPS